MGSIGVVRARPLVVGLATVGLGAFGLALPSVAAPAPSGTDVNLTSGTATQSVWTISNGNGTLNGHPAGSEATGSDCNTTGHPGLGVDEGKYDPTGANKVDAFDDGLLFFVNGQQVVAPTNWDVQVDPSDNTLNRVLTAGPVTTGGLSTTVEYRALPSQQVLRSTVYLSNTGTASVTIPFTVATNFGSDSNTVIDGSSSGDTTLTDADRWLVTSDSAATPGDAVNTSVLGGPGQVAAPPTATSQTVFECSGTEGLQATYNVTIPAGGTRGLMFLNELSATTAGAVSTAARFNTNPAATDELLSGLSEAQRDSIVNWRLTESQPDGLVRKPHAPYVGNNIYNTTAHKQTVRTKTRRGELQKFFVRIYNDGSTRTTFIANGVSSAKKVSVRYFVGRTDVTAAMKSSQGLSFPLAPGEFKQIKIKMKIPRSADAGVRKFAKVYATSASSGIVKQDAVKAMLIARG